MGLNSFWPSTVMAYSCSMPTSFGMLMECSWEGGTAALCWRGMLRERLAPCQGFRTRMLGEEVDGHFALTLEGAALQSGVPGSLRGFAVMIGEPWYWSMYGDLLKTVMTGQNGFEQSHGQRVYDYLAENPEAGKIF